MPDVVPKLHANVEPDIGAVVLVKLTSNGAHPDVVDAVKPAVSARASVMPKKATREINKVFHIFIMVYFGTLDRTRTTPFAKGCY